MDYYNILGVEKDADHNTIKKAYRNLAMKYHPDKNPGDKSAEDKFKEAAEAYEVLGNKDKRARYDQFGHAGLGGMNGGAGFTDINDIFGAFGDIFGDFFGGTHGHQRGRRGGPQRGSDLRYYLEVTLEDVLDGAQKEIKFDVDQVCTDCEGSGAAKGSQPETCSNCGGSGQHVRQQGFFSMSTPCPQCRGTGQIITQPCKPCHGHGKVPTKRKLKITVPPGVDNGTQLRLSEEGEAGIKGGPPGDLYVEMRVLEHKHLDRKGQHLIGQLEIDYIQALLGGKIQVKGLNEKLDYDISKGTQPGDVIRISGHGLPSLRTKKRGDLIVEVLIKIPKKLNKKEENLLREIAKIKGSKVKGGGIFN